MKKVKVFVWIVLCSATLLSCSSYRKSTANYGNEFNTAQADAEVSPTSDAANYYDAEKNIKKVLFSAFLTLKVKVPDTANVHIAKIAERYEGYVNEIGTYRTIIRVKSDRLQEALEEIAELGKVQRKTLVGKDVTEQYLDYQIRLENAEKSRERYLQLLAKAEDVESAVKVEKELERLNETIDLLKGKMKRINHLSEFSTITIRLKEKKKAGLLGYVGLGFYHAVKWLFVRN
ncbi:DUF4349 domain-containing protein [Aquimarina brevivitae]|uniref:Uncharacterized protein DUF4349 n=1 Tax=Aquimarina brevivitae TaxID=323412 RepID=A0A4Q7NUF1_9FLAO|nr:DUF4349 domain-containing protein [Aquimarina brevivitae]RZS90560.1 uncharacterized protein DUF4349 [Aquimarina brevivitae]